MMCGFAETKIRDEMVSLYLGTRGCLLTIGDTQYDQNELDIENRNAMIRKLNSYKKSELVEMILEFVEKGYER